jgi:hypothetical protein
MKGKSRTYSLDANKAAVDALQDLLSATSSEYYQKTMITLGIELGSVLRTRLENGSKCLVVSTAEDADFLSRGVRESIQSSFDTKVVVFWNNHYSLKTGGSVAPIVHKFMQRGYEDSDTLVIVKSVISGSCVVRTNILALIERVKADKIFVVSPVMHKNSEENLTKEFPSEVSSKFSFIYFAKDEEKDTTGEVKPGIGGQIYTLLGMDDQPARTAYMPETVKQLAFS